MGLVTPGTVQAHLALVLSPALHHHLRLQRRVEDLHMEKLIAQSAVERFWMAVLRPTAGLNEQPPAPIRRSLPMLLSPLREDRGLS